MTWRALSISPYLLLLLLPRHAPHAPDLCCAAHVLFPLAAVPLLLLLLPCMRVAVAAATRRHPAAVIGAFSQSRSRSGGELRRRGLGRVQGVAAQIEIESKVRKRFIVL